jgi:malonate-semialdehyde dehydrogenase (acetylating)/methylmalonate-semialdehyde dehydrogenase
VTSIDKLDYYIDGNKCPSKTSDYFDIWDPSTGEIIAHAPACTSEELNQVVKSAKKAFSAWSETPVMKRVQVLYNFRNLIEKHLDELVAILCKENGKVWDESLGDVLKAKEITELACGVPSLMMGESLMNTSSGYDTVLYREPLGVFVGIAPFNFPAMIPMGWMMPLCIATGNTMVLKASNVTPMTSMRMMELLYESGLPKGVVNLVTCTNDNAEIFLKHPDVKGITFVGSTPVGRHVYESAAASGKRVQTLCQAKNHALVLEDTPLERTALGIINSAYGCAGQRCMALPVIVVQETIADELVGLLISYAKDLKLGPAYDKTSQLGPIVTATHKESILKWIEKGIN